MDFYNENSSAQPSEVQPSGTPPAIPPVPGPGAKKRTSGWKIFWGIFTGLSVLANIALFLMLVGTAAFFAIGERRLYRESIIQSGPRTNRLAVIRIEGLIDSAQAETFHQQIKSAREDHTIKALIIRVNSAGGMVSASDEIYNEIKKFREEQRKPVVAFMQGVAASGGYYVSVACDTIVAEPTAVTGSIGVMMNSFVIRGLLEEKLGIVPVVIKSGPKKDWPSLFEPVTEEQKQYLDERLISPAYNRFVELVVAGRPMLSAAEVKKLADGSIFTGAQALNAKLIDQLGYLDDAVDAAKKLAGIKKAQVIEYRKLFSFADWLGAQSRSTLKIDRKTLLELATPQLLYLWQN